MSWPPAFERVCKYPCKYSREAVGFGCPCLPVPKSSYRQVQLRKCLGDGCSVDIPVSKHEIFLFSFPGLLLSGYAKTQHPVIEATSHRQKSWCKQTLSLRWKSFPPPPPLNHSPSDCESRVNNFQTNFELRVNNFLNHLL